MKEQEKITTKELKEMKYTITLREFNVPVTKILTTLEKRVGEKQSDMKNSITEIFKNTLLGINSRLEEGEKWFSELENRVNGKQ